MSHTQITSPFQFSFQKLLRICGQSLVAGLLLGIIGPFGTFESMNSVERFSFWGGAIALGMFIHTPLFYGAASLGRGYQWPAWAWVTVSAIIAALPMTFVVNGIATTLFPRGGIDNVVGLYPLVLAISLPMQWIAYFIAKVDTTPTPIATPEILVAMPALVPPAETFVARVETPLPTVAFLSKLPPRIGKDLLCLEMEDHYLRVHTKLGDAMIHLRMRDAVSELNGIDGMLVHRSWWVAREAITGWQRDGKTMMLQLSNGKSVPVARDRQPLVRAAGWLE
jgi:LytTr DNA-binding domain